MAGYMIDLKPVLANICREKGFTAFDPAIAPLIAAAVAAYGGKIPSRGLDDIADAFIATLPVPVASLSGQVRAALEARFGEGFHKPSPDTKCIRVRTDLLAEILGIPLGDGK